jgi:DNA-binding MarR family transcriptional regulator
MARDGAEPNGDDAAGEGAAYRLDDQIGFLLRRAHQRHGAIFAAGMLEGLTARQFAAMARLAEVGPCSQNQLGRLTAMDAATVKGVVDRLRGRGLVATRPSPEDRRRALVALTDAGAALIGPAQDAGAEITRRTLEPLSPRDQARLIALLRRIAD